MSPTKKMGRMPFSHLTGGKVAESYNIIFAPESRIPMREFDPKTGRSRTYLLERKVKDYPSGYTLMTAPNPEGILPDTLLIIREILNTEGRVVGMPEHSWANTLAQQGFFGIWDYLKLQMTELPAIVVVEDYKPEKAYQDLIQFPIAVSS